MLERKVARQALLSSGGKFLTVVFTKKDGSRRILNGRIGVTTYLQGGESKLDKEKFVIVYDVHARGYRAVDVSAIEEIRYGRRIIK